MNNQGNLKKKKHSFKGFKPQVRCLEADLDVSNSRTSRFKGGKHHEACLTLNLLSIMYTESRSLKNASILRFTNPYNKEPFRAFHKKF
jgi:hypothetical protein